jgi:hypothetical protein
MSLRIHWITLANFHATWDNVTVELTFRLPIPYLHRG